MVIQFLKSLPVFTERIESLFFELFSGLPRQGPGDSKSTERALRSIPNLSSIARILDIGCGTGSQTFVIAESMEADIVAIDSHAPYINELNQTAHEMQLANQVVGFVGDMRQLEFPNGHFDLIWCEGAIYNVGVEVALRDWRRYLQEHGYIAFTEVCWKKPNPPKECRDFWEQEYPSIRDQNELVSVIESSGYVVLEHFELSQSAWWDEYYRPLQNNIDRFCEKYRDDSDAQELRKGCQHEIDTWHAYATFYGYEFFVIKIS